VDYSTISAEELVSICCRSGDEVAWAEFVRRFRPLIARVALRVARQWGEVSPDVVDDLIQDTYLKLCAERTRILESFQPNRKDAVYAYIKVFTANLVHDRFKASHSSKRGGSLLATSIEQESSKLVPLNSQTEQTSLDRKVLIGQVDVCVRTITQGPSADRDRRIFWLYYRTGLSASAIAALPGIGLTTKGVESMLLRLTRQVKQKLLAGKENFEAAAGREGIRSAESF
jgi:RNA polymerase sigma-70 factor (ECF subfamily)